MGLSFSFSCNYKKNPNLTDGQVEALYTPVIDMVADVQLINLDDHLSFAVANYGSYGFVNQLQDFIEAAILATLDPEVPAQLIYSYSEGDGRNQYAYISHDPKKALEMELFDLNLELKSLMLRKNAVEKRMDDLKRNG